ncbi:Thioredoxin domain-containing protein [Entamoeba marina]
MQSLVKAHKAEPKVVYVDIDTNGKQFAEEKSGLKGRWPLLFNGDEFIGDLDTIVDLNEDGLLANKLK